MSIISIPGLGFGKSILLINDDELHFYNVRGGMVNYVRSIQWEESNFIVQATSIIRDECGNNPIIILDDSSEQFYRREAIPNIGSVMDRGNLVKRKLNVAFPNYDIKASLKLKDKSVSTKGDKAVENKPGKTTKYLFAAIPETDKTRLVYEIARQLTVPVQSYLLVPVEASTMIRLLSKKIFGSGKNKSLWTIFIGQNQNGGLRQIVTKNGELAMTRLTPVVDSSAEPDLWANEVMQEFKATLKYLARFDYNPDDGLDVITICNPETGECLDDLIDIPCNFRSLTVAQAADIINVKIHPVDTKHYVDRLHAGWVARKPSITMDMKPKELDVISKPRKVASLISLALVISLIYFGYTFMGASGSLMKKQTELRNLQQTQNRLDAELEDEIAKMNNLGFDVKLIRAATSTYNAYQGRGIESVDYIQRIDTALDNQITLKFISMDVVKTSVFEDGFRALLGNESGEAIRIRLGMLFPGATDPEDGNEEVDDISRRLKDEFPNHRVRVTKYLKDMTFDSEFTGEAGLSAREEQQVQDFSAEIEVVGNISSVDMDVSENNSGQNSRRNNR